MAGKEEGEELLYRISTEEEWEELRNTGSTLGGQLDKSTGFIHLSTLLQVRPTLQRFFLNTDNDLYLLQIDAKKLGDGLVYELVDASNVFPHFYGPSRSFIPLSLDAVVKSERLILSDGQSLKTRFLTPYLESVAPNFTNGANFAVAGSALLPRTTPFNLAIQVNQFIRFQNRSLQFSSKGVKGLLGDFKDFQNALYMLDIGQNDISAAFTYLSPEEVVQKIPSFISEIKDAIKRIYEHGGRNFWVHNTGPLGCMPQKLATTNVNATDFDKYGCIMSLNEGAKVFNRKLRHLCKELRSEMQNVTIVYVDIYAAKYDLFVNAAEYGFEKPLMVCCGYGGPPYNFNASVLCLQPGYNVCEKGSRYISWDGVHYTDAANSIVASKILSTNYSTPQIKLDHFCNIYS